MKQRIQCPKCKKVWLKFEQIQGIRLIYEELDGKRHFNVLCDNCGYFELPQKIVAVLSGATRTLGINNCEIRKRA